MIYGKKKKEKSASNCGRPTHHKLSLQDSGDLATDFSVAKSKKSVSKSFSDGFATKKNSVGKTLLAKLSDGNLQSVAKFSEGF